jgi:Holliday junction DNA helicase RuvA
VFCSYFLLNEDFYAILINVQKELEAAMLAYIRGTLEEMSEDSVILDHQGMGYQIYMSALDISELPGIGRSVLIYIHMNVREDGISLYGFRTKQAKEIFRLLIGISGVGPKAGMALLSALSVADIQMAVLSGDAKSLTKANGIGMKGAQRIIMELHDKIELESMLEPREDQSEAESAGAVTDEDITASVAMALVSLGYSQLEAMQAIRRVDAAQEMNTEELLKAALKKLI